MLIDHFRNFMRLNAVKQIKKSIIYHVFILAITEKKLKTTASWTIAEVKSIFTFSH